MTPRKRHEPMPVKYWSFAGLMLTCWCNARCDACYLNCGPDRSAEMTVETALRLWRELIEASPHGCRIHLSGGEPFGDWPRLIALCRRAQADGLAPLEKIETNAFWAESEPIVRRRIRALDEAGMGKLSISADPYHQQYVPIEYCRLAARVAAELLGPERVQVRWRDWLADGCDTGAMDPARRRALLARWAARGRDRLTGRAADRLTPSLQRKKPTAFADSPCKEALLRSRHVHVDADGRVMPGTCAGIVLGLARTRSIADLWRALDRDWDRRPVVSALAGGGPVALLEQVEDFVPADGYASKCHLCWDVRRHLVRIGRFTETLGPKRLYFRNTSGRDGVTYNEGSF